MLLANLTCHRSTANTSGLIRWAADVRYNGPEAGNYYPYETGFLGLFVDWRFVSFMADNSLGYFFAHLQDLRGVTQIRVLLGAALVFSFGRGRPGGTWLRKKGIL